LTHLPTIVPGEAHTRRPAAAIEISGYVQRDWIPGAGFTRRSPHLPLAARWQVEQWQNGKRVTVFLPMHVAEANKRCGR
jgi:hypothetical protein